MWIMERQVFCKLFYRQFAGFVGNIMDFLNCRQFEGRHLLCPGFFPCGPSISERRFFVEKNLQFSPQKTHSPENAGFLRVRSTSGRHCYVRCFRPFDDFFGFRKGFLMGQLVHLVRPRGGTRVSVTC